MLFYDYHFVTDNCIVLRRFHVIMFSVELYEYYLLNHSHKDNRKTKHLKTYVHNNLATRSHSRSLKFNVHMDEGNVK